MPLNQEEFNNVPFFNKSITANIWAMEIEVLKRVLDNCASNPINGNANAIRLRIIDIKMSL